MAEVLLDEEARSVKFTGELDEEAAHDIIDSIILLDEREPRDPIDFYINTYGGSAYDFMGVYDVMKSVDAKVNTIGVGKCMSAGIFLLMSGTGKRSAYPHTALLIHGLQTGIPYGSMPDNEIRHQQHKYMNEQIIEITNTETGRSIEEIKVDIERDLYLNTVEALSYGDKGIIDEIITRDVR